MALVNCPQCKGKVSDSADVCVHCGFNLLANNQSMTKRYTCIVDGTPIDFSHLHKKYGEDFKNRSFDENGYLRGLAEILGDEYEAVHFYFKVVKEGFPKTYTTQSNKPVSQPSIQSGVPRCPVCQSTSIQKIDAIDRTVSLAVLGLASGKIGKSRKCKTCGYLW